MRESVIYQEIPERGPARALPERRFGASPSGLAGRIERLTREQAEALAVETMAFDAPDAVRAWLGAQPVVASETPADDK